MRVGFQEENSVEQITPEGWRKTEVGRVTRRTQVGIDSGNGGQKIEVTRKTNVQGDWEVVGSYKSWSSLKLEAQSLG